MGHLEPSDDDLKALQLNAEESLQKAIGQIGIVNLATKSNAEVQAAFHANIPIFAYQSLTALAVRGAASTHSKTCLLLGSLTEQLFPRNSVEKASWRALEC